MYPLIKVRDNFSGCEATRERQAGKRSDPSLHSPAPIFDRSSNVPSKSPVIVSEKDHCTLVGPNQISQERECASLAALLDIPSPHSEHDSDLKSARTQYFTPIPDHMSSTAALIDEQLRSLMNHLEARALYLSQQHHLHRPDVAGFTPNRSSTRVHQTQDDCNNILREKALLSSPIQNLDSTPDLDSSPSSLHEISSTTHKLDCTGEQNLLPAYYDDAFKKPSAAYALACLCSGGQEPPTSPPSILLPPITDPKSQANPQTGPDVRLGNLYSELQHESASSSSSSSSSISFSFSSSSYSALPHMVGACAYPSSPPSMELPQKPPTFVSNAKQKEILLWRQQVYLCHQ